MWEAQIMHEGEWRSIRTGVEVKGKAPVIRHEVKKDSELTLSRLFPKLSAEEKRSVRVKGIMV